MLNDGQKMPGSMTAETKKKAETTTISAQSGTGAGAKAPHPLAMKKSKLKKLIDWGGRSTSDDPWK